MCLFFSDEIFSFIFLIIEKYHFLSNDKHLHNTLKILIESI